MPHHTQQTPPNWAFLVPGELPHMSLKSLRDNSDRYPLQSWHLMQLLREWTNLKLLLKVKSSAPGPRAA